MASGAYVPKNQHQQQQHNMQAAAMAASYTGNWGQMSAQMSAAMNNNAMSIPAGQRSPAENSLLAQAGNRTVYLGWVLSGYDGVTKGRAHEYNPFRNIHPDTTVEEICESTMPDAPPLAKNSRPLRRQRRPWRHFAERSLPS